MIIIYHGAHLAEIVRNPSVFTFCGRTIGKHNYFPLKLPKIQMDGFFCGRTSRTAFLFIWTRKPGRHRLHSAQKGTQMWRAPGNVTMASAAGLTWKRPPQCLRSLLHQNLQGSMVEMQGDYGWVIKSKHLCCMMCPLMPVRSSIPFYPWYDGRTS